ncbi:Ferri-bacillibactin esterase BesA [Thalassoglobus polymorphus]|uniref:Ferri-bacillibactin esterase BesA n=2 Tax=Thalassoglobus polymorphus TaxID=2527994 RepID=A0A517QNE1_9PLAN|nr:Ferri-bacillibactin esterase BesA [Thalassoglobus polymorphus]
MFLVLFSVNLSYGSEPPAVTQADVHSLGEFTLAQTEVFDFTSRRGSVYRIFISEPKGPASVDGYSVLYVLDANANFGTLVEAQRHQSRGRAGLKSTPVVLVGIGYPTEGPYDFKRRTYDLTTPALPENLPRRPGGREWPKSGGADEFLDFIQGELKPHIESRVRIDRSRQAIYGHSFGGLFVLHTLFSRPDAFQNYIAASPSVWWNDYATLKAEKQFSTSVVEFDSRKRLLITLGELELTEDGGPAALLAPTAAKKTFGNTKDFAERLASLEAEQFTFSYREFPGEDHGSVVPFALIESLRFVLNTSAE